MIPLSKRPATTMIPTGMVMPKIVFVDESVLRVDVGALLLDVVVDATLVSREQFREGPVGDEPVNETVLRKESERSSILRLIHEETPVLSRVNGAPIVITIVEKVDRVSQVCLLFE